MRADVTDLKIAAPRGVEGVDFSPVRSNGNTLREPRRTARTTGASDLFSSASRFSRFFALLSLSLIIRSQTNSDGRSRLAARLPIFAGSRSPSPRAGLTGRPIDRPASFTFASRGPDDSRAIPFACSLMHDTSNRGTSPSLFAFTAVKSSSDRFRSRLNTRICPTDETSERPTLFVSFTRTGKEKLRSNGRRKLIYRSEGKCVVHRTFPSRARTTRCARSFAPQLR